MSAFEVGEHVDIAIKGARIESIDDVGIAVCSLPSHAWRPTINLRAAGVVVDRVAPKEWPPQPGDVWEGADGTQWFVNRDDDIDVMLSATGRAFKSSPDGVLGSYGPVRLVYRRGWSPEPAPAAAEDEQEQLDKRAEVIAGLRELADWYEANPGIPLDLYGWEMLSCISEPTEEAERAELLRIADLVGEPADLTATHPCVRRRFRGNVGYRAYYIPAAKPAEAKDLTRGVEVAAPAGESGAAIAPAHEDDAGAPRLEEVAGPRLGEDSGPATDEPEPEHYHVGGAAGGPGDNEAECACGATYAGFDTHAEASAALDRHIADETATSAEQDALVDGTSQAGVPFAGDVPAAEPDPVATGDGPAVAPDDELVWVARRRHGIYFHALNDTSAGQFAVCGRSAFSGVRLPRHEAADFGQPCPRCYPHSPAGAAIS